MKPVSEIIPDIEKMLQTKFQAEATGHDWHHIDRVRKMALLIHEKEGGNRRIIELAALLHDVSDHKFNGGNYELGRKQTYDILSAYNLPEDEINHIAEIVDQCSFSKNRTKSSLLSKEAQIVQDADRLDALGAIGIARTFAYGAHVGQPIFDPLLSESLDKIQVGEPAANKSTINHFYEKLLLLERLMNTPTGRAIAEKRTVYLTNYLEAFFDEWEQKDFK